MEEIRINTHTVCGVEPELHSVAVSSYSCKVGLYFLYVAVYSLVVVLVIITKHTAYILVLEKYIC